MLYYNYKMVSRLSTRHFIKFFSPVFTRAGATPITKLLPSPAVCVSGVKDALVLPSLVEDVLSISGENVEAE